ncbi:MAG: DUF4956 domain-containing protein [Actinomycetaceae bacterium]|nr:DUF4956 domain-containing protein [Actinomycetaceae bacterium]
MNYISFGIDAAAICILVFALYVPRHRRKDLAVALLGVNVGVLGVTTVLATSDVAAGLGLGLFGVLSIIRLRSTELSQVEVAYYFASLAIGLIAGLAGSSIVAASGFIAAIVLVLAIADASKVMSRSGHMSMMVDRAIHDNVELASHIEKRTGFSVREVSIIRLDYLNDSTFVDVRYSDGKSGNKKEKAGRFGSQSKAA